MKTVVLKMSTFLPQYFQLLNSTVFVRRQLSSLATVSGACNCCDTTQFCYQLTVDKQDYLHLKQLCATQTFVNQTGGSQKEFLKKMREW